MRYGPYTRIPSQPHPPTRQYEAAGRSPTMPTNPPNLPRVPDLIQQAKEQAGPDGSPAHELRMLAIRERDSAKRIRIGVAVEEYALEQEREVRRLRHQLTDLQREITSRVAHSTGCREIARDRGLIEDVGLPEPVEVEAC